MVVLVIGYAIFAVLFAALGFFFLSDTCALKIAEHNTMPQNERKKLDEAKLCRFIGKLLFSLSGCILIAIIGVITKHTWLHMGSWGVAILIFLIAWFYTSTKDRFKKS